MLRSMTVRSAIVAFACMVTAAAYARADSPKPVNVAAGDLVDALDSLAKQCGVDVIYPSGQLKGLKTHGVNGTLETRAAFLKLLEGTRLVIKEEGTALLIALPAGGPTTPSTPAPAPAAAPTAEPAAAADAVGEEEIGEVTVTGSRIQRRDATSVGPI